MSHPRASRSRRGAHRLCVALSRELPISGERLAVVRRDAVSDRVPAGDPIFRPRYCLSPLPCVAIAGRPCHPASNLQSEPARGQIPTIAWPTGALRLVGLWAGLRGPAPALARAPGAAAQGAPSAAALIRWRSARVRWGSERRSSGSHRRRAGWPSGSAPERRAETTHGGEVWRSGESRARSSVHESPLLAAALV
jgi:hypothetical protein